uniref:Taste receptor, type 1, member 2, tandem duplicate 2 n=1 Tax=Sinocyclocheilus rhinocerous TaxID=307959 RepID=A0A673KZI7_9TELE
MRFAIEEMNNSTTLLPNVSLGYDIFDHCSNTKNFSSVLTFISKKGPYRSTSTITIAPLITMGLIPMVNYGASSYALSNKLQYPSFIRTVPSNKDMIEMIIHIIRWFGWNWVAFLGSQNNYSSDGLNLLNKYISNTGICLAYQEAFSQRANYSLTLKKIDMLNINVIVVFAVPQYAVNIIKTAIAENIRDKVWIESESWAINQQLPREPGIGNIGTVIGIRDCYLFCDYCPLLTAEEIINENPSFSFAIYLTFCSTKSYMLMREIKKLDFPINDRQVKYDENYDPTISYAVYWHKLHDGIGHWPKPKMVWMELGCLSCKHNQNSHSGEHPRQSMD